MKVPRYMMRTPVTVEPYLGDSAKGPTFGPAVTVRGHWEGKRRMYTTDDGRNLISEATFYCDTDENLPLESKVTRNSTVYRVVQVLDHDYGFGNDPEHLEVLLMPFRKTGTQ